MPDDVGRAAAVNRRAGECVFEASLSRADVEKVSLLGRLLLSEAELDTFLAECIDAAGATSVKDLGKVMGVIKAKAGGRVDMSTVSARVRTMLTPE